MGVAVAGATSAALAAGLKGEPQPCPECSSAGGVECLFCEGTGRMESKVIDPEAGRNALGLTTRNPYECRSCAGVGTILCSRCKGTGYISGL